MKPFHLLQLAAALFLAAASVTTANAAYLQGQAPAVQSNKIEAQQRVCHHYRWSSRSHCTSAQVLRYVARPPLYYPHKYYGGTPHYFVRQPTYWHAYPSYYHHRWHYWGYRPYPFYYW